MWRAYEILKRSGEVGKWYASGYLSVKPDQTPFNALKDHFAGKIEAWIDYALVPQGDCDDRSYLFFATGGY